MKNKLMLCVLFASVASLTGCNNEQDDLARAQACLDHVDQSAPTQADDCLQYVEKYDSQQASILKCSIYMTSGGLVENKIIKAYNALKDTSITNKEAAYMSILSLDHPDTTGYDKAVSANNFCQASGVPGLMYLSNIVLAGTTMNRAIAGIVGSVPDISNPAAVETAVNTMLADCTSATPSASCTENLATLGQATVSLASSYCDKSNSDQDVCATINSTVAATNGDTSEVGQALFCYLKKMTYNTTTHQCQ